MPKRLSDYDLHDFLHLRPLTQAMRTMRYRHIDRTYCARPAREGQEAAVRTRLAGKRVVLTVAFGDPEILLWHLALVRRFVPVDEHVVLDNSPDTEIASAIRDIVSAAGRLYLRLPANPWTGKNGSRSHGLALNWAWHRVIRPAQPAAFGFLDADMLPLAPDDPFALLDGHTFGGDKRWALDRKRWFLWAGYCFFRFTAVADKPLDFGLDWFIGLDTGGANWDALYCKVAPDSLPRRPIVEIAALSGVPLKQCYFERRGDWIHEVGWAGDPALRPAKRDVTRAMVAPLLGSA